MTRLKFRRVGANSLSPVYFGKIFSPPKNPKNNKNRQIVRRRETSDTLYPYLLSPHLPSQRGGTGLPVTLIQKLKYTTVINLQTSVAGAVTSYQWNPLDLYDPDRTITGQQWYLRDQVSTLYGNYRGVKSHYRFRLQTYAGAATDAIVFCVRPNLSGTTSVYTDMQLAISQPYAQSHVLVNGQKEYVVEGTILPWELIGIPKSQYFYDVAYLSAVGSSPATAVVLNLVYGSANAGSQPYLVGTLELETEFQYVNPLVQTMS